MERESAPSSNGPTELKGLWVSVDKVEYHTELEAEPERPHPFVYYITIHNDSTTTVDILARKWVVTEENGGKQIIEGAGVVGERPHLPPGESFNYNSYHIIGCDSTAEGAYFGITAEGLKVFTRIPAFEMHVPQS